MAVTLEPPVSPSLALHPGVLGRTTDPVVVDGDSIKADPVRMGVGQYYLATVKGKPYLCRKNSAGEIELYGLAD